MKLAHTADLHISDQSHLTVLRMIVEAANLTGCEHLLIAGDLFDSDESAKIFSRSACDLLNQFKGSTWLIPGNHDPSTGTFCFVERGKVFKQAESVKLSRDIWLTGIPYVRNKGLFDLIIEKSVEKKGNKTIMLMHGTLHARGRGITQDLHFPVMIEDLKRFECFYAAMGHYHLSFSEKADGLYVVNPGSPRVTRVSDYGRRKLVIFDTSTNLPADFFLDVPYNEPVDVAVDFVMGEVEVKQKCIATVLSAVSRAGKDTKHATVIIKFTGTLSLTDADFAKCKAGIEEGLGQAGIRYLFDISGVRSIGMDVLGDPSVKEILERIQTAPFDNKSELELFTLRLLSGIYGGKL
jgi:DNA repair exonuclease SbcCD nuclease subunit